MRYSFPTLLMSAGFALVGVAAAAAKSLPTIDDFTTGPSVIAFNGAKQTGNLETTVTKDGALAHLIGGERGATLLLNLAGNPYAQNANLLIRNAVAGTPGTPALLAVSNGFGTDAQTQLGYGSYASSTLSLNANLTPYNRIRVHFLAISGGVNFNIEAASSSSKVTQWGCNLFGSFSPQVVDFPLANGHGVGSAGAANLAAVEGLFFEFQEAGFGGYDFAVTKIEMAPASAAAGDVTCPPLTGG